MVIADFAQPAPDRTVTVVRSASDGVAVLDLNVSGPAYEHGPPFGPVLADPGRTVEVTVQRRLPGTVGDVGWIEATGDPGVRVVTHPVRPVTGQP